MSSRREVFIRILALLQRKTLIETKNLTLKYLKWHVWLCDQWKMLQCWRRTGHLPSFFVPTPGDLTVQESPPQKFADPRQKKMLMPRGSAPGEGAGGGGARCRWNWLMHKKRIWMCSSRGQSHLNCQCRMLPLQQCPSEYQRHFLIPPPIVQWHHHHRHHYLPIKFFLFVSSVTTQQFNNHRTVQ